MCSKYVLHAFTVKFINDHIHACNHGALLHLQMRHCILKCSLYEQGIRLASHPASPGHQHHSKGRGSTSVHVCMTCRAAKQGTHRCRHAMPWPPAPLYHPPAVKSHHGPTPQQPAGMESVTKE